VVKRDREDSLIMTISEAVEYAVYTLLCSNAATFIIYKRFATV